MPTRSKKLRTTTPRTDWMVGRVRGRGRVALINSVVWSMIVCAVVTACSGTDSTGIPAILTTNLYSTLRLNVRAAVMSTVAPYDTMQLVPTAYNTDGTLIPLPGPATYAVSDTFLTVSATGLVTVKHKTGTNSYVIARVQDTVLNVTQADTVFILGTTTVPTAPLASYSIQLAGTDSAILDVSGGKKTLAVTALDANHTAIPAASLVSHFLSSNVTLATIVARSGVLTAVNPGTVLITASTRYYGVLKSDSLRMTIGYPDVTMIEEDYNTLENGTISYDFNLANWVVGVNKTIIFESELVALSLLPTSVYEVYTNVPLSVVFDDPSAAQMSPISGTVLAKQFVGNGSGNISITIPDSLLAKDSVVYTGTTAHNYFPQASSYCKSTPYPCAAARSFSTPGTYHYHDAQTGASGVITVATP